MPFNTAPHEWTLECQDFHCTAHNVDEPKEGFRLCGECGHMYATAHELVQADYDIQALARSHGWTKKAPEYQRASKIYACPTCTHDF